MSFNFEKSKKCGNFRRSRKGFIYGILDDGTPIHLGQFVPDQYGHNYDVAVAYKSVFNKREEEIADKYIAEQDALAEQKEQEDETLPF